MTRARTEPLASFHNEHKRVSRKVAEPLRKGPAVTLEDVAGEAGTSAMTVSRALNDPEKVSTATYQRVIDAVNKLNYRPNIGARQLARRANLSIGLLIENPSLSYTHRVFDSALRACEADHHDLIFSHDIRRSLDLEENLRALKIRNSGLDGLIVAAPLSEDESFLSSIKKSGIPFLLLASCSRMRGAPRIGMNNRDAAAEMTAWLLDRGHRRIAYLGGNPVLHSAHERLRGFLEVMEARGMDLTDGQVLTGDYSFASGYELTGRTLQPADRPDAIFAANDDMAAGAISALHAAHLSVPTDISVVGLDDMPIATQTTPSITTMRQPLDEMLTEAVRRLERLIRGKRVPAVTEYPVTLQLRESAIDRN